MNILNFLEKKAKYMNVINSVFDNDNKENNYSNIKVANIFCTYKFFLFWQINSPQKLLNIYNILPLIILSLDNINLIS